MLDPLIKHIVGPTLEDYLTRRRLANQNILTFGARIALRACDGNYARVDENDNRKLFARDRYVSESTTFEIVDASTPFLGHTDRVVRYGDEIALKEIIYPPSFVGVGYGIYNELTARVPWVKEHETFVLFPPSNGERYWLRKPVRYGYPVALRAFYGEFVGYNRDGDKILSAVANHIQEWEEFVVIDPLHPK